MDPMKQFAEEDAKELAEINLRRKAAGLPEFAALDNAAERWSAENPPAEGEQPTAAGAEQTGKPKEPEAKTAQEPIVVPSFKPAQNGAVAQTDAEKEELKKEIQRLKSEQGRSTVLANQLHQLEEQLAESKKKAEEAQRKAAELEEKASLGDPMSVLSQEEREAISDNPAAAAAILKIARQAVKGSIAAPDLSEVSALRKRFDESEAARLQREQSDMERSRREHDEAVRGMMAGIAKESVPQEVWGRFASNPKWDEFGRATFGGIQNAALYQNALDSLDKEAVVELFGRFMRYAGISLPARASKPPLKFENERGSGAAETLKPDDPKTFSYDEVKRIEDNYFKKRVLPSGWTEDQFSKWSDEVDAARAEGRVIDAQGNRRTD